MAWSLMLNLSSFFLSSKEFDTKSVISDFHQDGACVIFSILIQEESRCSETNSQRKLFLFFSLTPMGLDKQLPISSLNLIS